MAKEKLTFISILYTFGAILIVLSHSFNYIESLAIERTRVIIVYFAMTMFFFCGGLLLNYTKSVERKGFAAFVLGKVLRLLVPYVVLSSVFYFPKQLLEHNGFSFYSYFEMLFAPRLNSLGHFWFIPVLFGLYLIFAIYIYYLNKNKINEKISILFLLSAFIVLHFIHIDKNFTWLGIPDICNYGIFFCLGYALSDFIVVNIKKICNYKFLILFGVLSLFSGYVIFNDLLKSDYYLSLVGVSFLPTFFILSYMVRSLYDSMFFKFFEGKYYTIYLLHWLIVYPLIMVFDKALHLGLWSRLIVFVLGLVIPVFAVNLVNKFNIKNTFIKLVLGI